MSAFDGRIINDVPEGNLWFGGGFLAASVDCGHDGQDCSENPDCCLHAWSLGTGAGGLQTGVLQWSQDMLG